MKKYYAFISLILISSLIALNGCKEKEEDILVLSDILDTVEESDNVTDTDFDSEIQVSFDNETSSEESESTDRIFTRVYDDELTEVVEVDLFNMNNRFVIENATFEGYNQKNVNLYHLNHNEQIDITVTCTNDMPYTRNQTLLIFQDGILSEFVVNGLPCKYYDMEIEDELNFSVLVVPSFKNNMGQLNLVFLEEKKIPSDTLYASLPVYFDLEDEQSNDFHETVEPLPLINAYQTVFAPGSTCLSGGFPWGVETPDDERIPSTMPVKLLKGEPLSVDLYCPNDLNHPIRSTFLVNNHPIEFEMNDEKRSYVEWCSSENRMTRVATKLLSVEESDHYFFRSINIPVIPFDYENQDSMIFYSIWETELEFIE